MPASGYRVPVSASPVVYVSVVFYYCFFSFVVSNDLGQIQGSKTNPGSLNRNKAFKIAANGLATRRILNFAGVASEIMEFGFSMDGGDSFLTKKLRDPKEFYSTANAKLGSVMLSIPQATAPCAKKSLPKMPRLKFECTNAIVFR